MRAAAPKFAEVWQKARIKSTQAPRIMALV
jgi:hypothetical protein